MKRLIMFSLSAAFVLTASTHGYGWGAGSAEKLPSDYGSSGGGYTQPQPSYNRELQESQNKIMYYQQTGNAINDAIGQFGNILQQQMREEAEQERNRRERERIEQEEEESRLEERRRAREAEERRRAEEERIRYAALLHATTAKQELISQLDEIFKDADKRELEVFGQAAGVPQPLSEEATQVESEALPDGSIWQNTAVGLAYYSGQNTNNASVNAYEDEVALSLDEVIGPESASEETSQTLGGWINDNVVNLVRLNTEEQNILLDILDDYPWLGGGALMNQIGNKMDEITE